jgi:glutathione S-transferase
VTLAAALTDGRPHVFADEACPFAHRVLALLDHLGLAYDLTESPVGMKPPGLEQWSPSGRIPFFVHGPLAIGESRVILEYLAEEYGLESGRPRGPVERAQQGHAMALFDGSVVPRIRGDDDAGRRDHLVECLDVLTSVTRASPPEPSVLAFHVAPMWLRLQWWRPEGRATREIRERPELAAWLDAVANLASIARTSPSREQRTADFLAKVAGHPAARL